MSKADLFKYFHSRSEIITLAVMMCVRFPLSLRNAEDLLRESGIDISYDTVRFITPEARGGAGVGSKAHRRAGCASARCSAKRVRMPRQLWSWIEGN